MGLTAWTLGSIWDFCYQNSDIPQRDWNSNAHDFRPYNS